MPMSPIVFRFLLALFAGLLLLPGKSIAEESAGAVSGTTLTLGAGETKTIPHNFALPLSKLRVSVIEGGKSLSEQETKHYFKFTADRGATSSFHVKNITAETRTITVAASPHATVERAGFTVSMVFLALLLGTFVAMTAFGAPIPLAMSMLACAFLALSWSQAEQIAHTGFRNFAEIAIIFTAVAIPAHMIERSRGFEWMAAVMGQKFGRLRLNSPRLALPLLVTLLLVFTYVLAGLMHNITSMLIMTPIIIRICDSYGVPSRWILCAALIASNLGGFSTRWGDTPNIVEAREWGLVASDFTREILPPNLIVLAVLTLTTIFLTQRAFAKAAASQADPNTLSGPRPGQTLMTAMGAAGWEDEKTNITVDRRIFSVGAIILVTFIVTHVVWHELSMTLGGIAILAAVLLERARDREHTLKSLGFDVYITFAAIFIIAGCIKNSWIGFTLQDQIEKLHFAPWAITITGYFGTMFTEAGSWVSAVAEDIAAGDLSHKSAWALGAGICAGSSSILTAASAGIILWEQSARYKEHAITFRKYLPFGIGFSLFMLIFYSLYFSFIFKG
jgi:Na+/H+ antiporter NhaD/arsenite permease-like protein